jgi:hypothetical protein
MVLIHTEILLKFELHVYYVYSENSIVDTMFKA